MKIESDEITEVELSQHMIVAALADLKAMRIILKEHEGLVENLKDVEILLSTVWAKYSCQQHLIQELQKKNAALGNFVGLR